jgi:hypothetical protein
MLKRFESFNDDKDKIIRTLDSLGIHGGYNITEDLSVDVYNYNGVYIKDKFSDGKLPLKFNKISKWFVLQNNNLTTLEGCPNEVGEGFACTDNLITSLDGCPTITNKSSFNCYNNKLTSMKGCPNEVDQFIFDYNNLTSLEFSTEIVNDRFSCTYNKLTSLEFGPKKVKGDYSVGYNDIYNLDGFECEFGGEFLGQGNPLNKVFPLDGLDYMDLKAFKTYKVVTEKKVNWKRLEYLYHQFNIEVPDELQLEISLLGYEII